MHHLLKHLKFFKFLKYLLLFNPILLSSQGYAIFLDGKGHYALKGETITAPGAATDQGEHQAIEQSFQLQGEARLNEKSSFFMELRLFGDEDSSYMGNEIQPEECEKGENCGNTPQNVLSPGYKPYSPMVTRAFVRFASDYCIVEAGRRPRSWGMGLYLDAGDAPFSRSFSTYDGISCYVNAQKAQTLGFSFGYDKLTETSKSWDKDNSSISYGPSHKNGDVDQYFITIEHDDRLANAGSGFQKHVGIYAAKIVSGSLDKGGLGTDLTIIDLYTGFFINDLSFMAEFLIRLGKTGDPAVTRLGGAKYSKGELAQNTMDAFGGAFRAEWNFGGSGTSLGPQEFGKGNASRHQLFSEYIFAPGDSNGYYDGDDLTVGKNQRKNSAKAMAFNKNFSPALVLFNGKKALDHLAVDGIFHPSRVINSVIFDLGYRYYDQQVGNFETKLIIASLNKSIPSDVKNYYSSQSSKPVGYYGLDLGTEIDLKYWRSFGRELDAGVGIGYLLPGQAFKTNGNTFASNSTSFQSFLAFNF